MTAERWLNDRFGRYFAWFPILVVTFGVALSSSFLVRFEIALIAACVGITYIGYEIDSFRRARKFEDLQIGFQDFREYAGARFRRNGNLLEDIDRGTKAILEREASESVCQAFGGTARVCVAPRTTAPNKLTTREEDLEARSGSYPYDLERRWENAVRAYHRNKLGPNDVEMDNQADSYPCPPSIGLGGQTNVYPRLALGGGTVSVAQSANQVGSNQALGADINYYPSDLQSLPNYTGTATKLEAYDEVGPTSLHPF